MNNNADSKFTSALFPHTIYCSSRGAEGAKNFTEVKPELKKCPICDKPKGTDKDTCNFTVKY